ncbi:MAG: hypothetical protein IKV76_03725 [Clostridia bacterium]|nr:hypothetical protein [Clostridia bacterium]
MIETLKEKYAKELAYLQSLFADLGVDTLKESILMDAVNRAYVAIRNYLRLDENEDVTIYFDAAVALAKAYYNNSIIELNKATGKRTVTQKSQGSRSITYGTATTEIDNNGLTADVKALLPLPRIKFYC